MVAAELCCVYAFPFEPWRSQLSVHKIYAAVCVHRSTTISAIFPILNAIERSQMFFIFCIHRSIHLKRKEENIVEKKEFLFGEKRIDSNGTNSESFCENNNYTLMNTCIWVICSFGFCYHRSVSLCLSLFFASQFRFAFASIHWRNNRSLKSVAISANVIYNFACYSAFLLLLLLFFVCYQFVAMSYPMGDWERLKRTETDRYTVHSYKDLNRYTK